MIHYGRESTTNIATDMNPEVYIGNFTSVAIGTTFYGRINYPSISNQNLVCNRGMLNLKSNFRFNISKGPIHVGNDVWIGYGCDILSGVTIGDGAIVGMKTVVSKDIPPYAVVVGHPMTIAKYRFSQEIIEKLLKIKWWDWDTNLILERNDDFLDVDKFVEKYYGRET